MAWMLAAIVLLQMKIIWELYMARVDFTKLEDAVGALLLKFEALQNDSMLNADVQAEVDKLTAQIDAAVNPPTA
jgi:hypothetical protein